ncbi:hypothetical protein DAEQUDRAFT_445458 [Daedalea quercina L-15889]|uniref:Uncharacterized protein n=1 Tax=Daedalea quercina L-15889 TaxID=1314783 RepID=A0A165N7U5_9APHY|nr:hypothetical protein DAEQUDRAFT_445458 [Daedalea quercina L-15889]
MRRPHCIAIVFVRSSRSLDAEDNGGLAQKAGYAALHTKVLLASLPLVLNALCDLIAPTIPHPISGYPSHIHIDKSRHLR